MVVRWRSVDAGPVASFSGAPAPAPAAPGDSADARPAAIRLRNVSKRYGSQVALAPTDLEILDGEFFCLLGPSGCGKTTTLNLIGGFVEASSGEIHIGGRRADSLPPHKRSVNTVFQSYALFPHMTVEENVGFGLRMARTPRAEAGRRVAEAIERVGLGGLAKRYPGHLSGGQQQRVAVARALVNEPAVLLLDEPLGALDLKLRKRLQYELTQIQREVGTTFVYVTHDQEEAMAMADRVAVLHAGRIEQVGTPRDVYERPVSRFVADFIGESNFLPVTVVDERTGAVALRDGRPLPPAARARAKGPHVLMVRPEAVRISRADAEAPGVEGRVAASTFLGSYTRLVVECAGLEPIVVALQGAPADEQPDLAAGTPVLVSWAPEKAVVLDEPPNTQEEEAE